MEILSIRPVVRNDIAATRRSPQRTLKRSAPALAGKPPASEGWPTSLTEDYTFRKQGKSSSLGAPSPVDSDISPEVKTSDQAPPLIEVSQSQALVQRNESGSASKRRKEGLEAETNGSVQHSSGKCLSSKNLHAYLCCYLFHLRKISCRFIAIC